MAKQRIILIHGRSTKPGKAAFEALQKKALLHGLTREGSGKGKKIEDEKVAIDFVYYGDVNNALLAEKSKKMAKRLTAKDPHCGNLPCEPHQGLDKAIDILAAMPNFSARTYKKVLEQNEDRRWLDNAANAVSTFAAITTATFLNKVAINKTTPDMGAYLLTRKVGSEIRERLQKVLRPAIRAGDDICLVSHSMGCMVAYDVLWKFSRMSEYSELQESGNKISKWVTLGCPLGEAGVKRNLYDGDERREDKYPREIVLDWVNIAAKDDFVAHDRSIKDDYSYMTRSDPKLVNSIRDEEIYNCFFHDGVSNPHKLYGYLAHEKVGKEIADWIK